MYNHYEMTEHIKHDKTLIQGRRIHSLIKGGKKACFSVKINKTIKTTFSSHYLNTLPITTLE